MLILGSRAQSYPFRKVFIAAGLAALLTTFIAPSGALAEDSKFLVGVVDWLNGVKAKVCTDSDPGSPTLSSGLLSWFDSAPTSPAFKTDSDLNRYLECYAVETGRYEKIKHVYMPLIDAAASGFKVPKAMLACLIFKESRFDPGARSYTGAMGLGQHLQSTMGDITKILKPMGAEELRSLQEIASRTVEESMAKSGKSKDQAKEDLAYAKNRLMNRENRLGWERYYETLSQRKLHKGPPPRAVNPVTIQNPKIAIGATALYVKSILYHFQARLDGELQIDNSENKNPNFDAMLASAGAYNMGPGIAAQLLRDIEPPDRAKWVETLARANEETAQHILSIKRCMESSKTAGFEAWRGPINSPTYECNDGNESRSPRLVLFHKNPLPKQYENKFKTAQMKGMTTPPVAPPQPKVKTKAKVKKGKGE